MRLSELQSKNIVNVANGKNIGNIIDANVFAHFNTFDISDDLTFNVEPALISPASTNGRNFAYTQMPQSFGLQMNLKF